MKDSLELLKLTKMRSHPHYRKIWGSVYISLLPFILSLSFFLPSYEVSSSVYHEVYFSTQLSLLKIGFYMTLLVSGYMYVTGVTLRFKRASFFAGRDGKPWNFLGFVVLGFGMFWAGPNSTLIDIEAFDNLDEFLTFYCIYASAFVLMLHFSYLDSGPLKKISLNIAKMKKYTVKDWVLFVFLSIGVVLITVVEFYYLYQFNRFWLYVGLYGGLIGCLMIIAIYMSKTHILHVHHYMVGMIFLPMTAIPNSYAAFIQGLCVGLYTEGCARWGLDPLFHKIE